MAGRRLMGRARRRRVAFAALTFAAALAAFSLGASRRAAWRTDELRYLEVAREMSLPDASLTVPSLGGSPYVHKPPGFFWATLALHRGLGLDLESAGKGVSAVAAAAMVALVFDLGLQLGGVHAGVAAALVLASAQMFTSLALRANLDALLAAWITAGLWAFALAEGVAGTTSARAPWLRLLAGFCCGMALLVKGPVAIGIPAVVVLAFLALRGRALALRPWLPALAAMALPPLVWLGLAWLDAGPDYVSELVLGHGVAHALGGVGKLRPFWFYFRQVPVGFAPWSLLLPAAALLAWRRRARHPGDAFLLAWSLAPFVLLSLFPAKRHLYLLPAYPGAALLVGRWLAWSRRPATAPDPTLGAWSRFGRRATGAVLVVAACLAGEALLSGLADREPFAGVTALATPSVRAAAALALVLSVAAGALLASARRAAAWDGGLALSGAALVLMIGAFHPLESAAHDASAFYDGVARRVAGGDVAVLAGLNFAPELWLSDATIRRVAEPADAVPTGPGDEDVWLLAEQALLDASPGGDAFEPVLRYAPALDDPLLLLRVHAAAPPPGAPRAVAPAPHAAAAPPRRDGPGAPGTS